MPLVHALSAIWSAWLMYRLYETGDGDANVLIVITGISVLANVVLFFAYV